MSNNCRPANYMARVRIIQDNVTTTTAATSTLLNTNVERQVLARVKTIYLNRQVLLASFGLLVIFLLKV